MTTAEVANLFQASYERWSESYNDHIRQESIVQWKPEQRPFLEACVSAVLARVMCSYPERFARLFHDAYERLSPEYGVPILAWKDLTSDEQSLMVKVSGYVLHTLEYAVAGRIYERDE